MHSSVLTGLLFAYHPRNTYDGFALDMSPADPTKKGVVIKVTRIYVGFYHVSTNPHRNTGDNSRAINARLSGGVQVCRHQSVTNVVSSAPGITHSNTYYYHTLVFKQYVIVFRWLWVSIPLVYQSKSRSFQTISYFTARFDGSIIDTFIYLYRTNDVCPGNSRESELQNGITTTTGEI